MSQTLADVLPDRQVEADTADELETLDDVEQCVAVRGTYDGTQMAYQLLFNIVGQGLVALDYDENAGWRVVYDSSEDDEPADDDETLYRRAHDALFAHAEPDPDETHFETTPEFWTAPDEE